MKVFHIARVWSVLAAVAVMAACASSPQTSEDSGPVPGAGDGAVTIRVENNRADASTIVVHIAPEAGVRRRLGEVDAASAAAFPYRGQPGMYRLVAIGQDGQEIRSDSFRLFASSTAIWNMQTNRVSVSGR